MVLGHGRAAEDRGSLNDQPGVEKFDSRIIQANELIDDYFSKTYKPTDSLIDEHAAFFRRLCEVERVYVLGHSLSPIDRPYFSALLVVPGLKTANWYAAVRKDSDPTKTVETLVEFGVHKDKACTILWTEA